MERKYLSIIAPLSLCLLLSCGGTRPDFVGRGHGNLADCPNTPNCVSTLSTDSKHKIEPLHYTTDTKDAMQILVDIIKSLTRTKIITQTENYLYIEFTSAFWRFVDDVEFSFDEENKIIHFRSASRLGKSDLGVNRERMEHIRDLFKDKLNKVTSPR
jgi:uncharacterized protein (DUF1499 family)